jgi:hypothetical protein
MINAIIQKYGFNKYLEIGVFDPIGCFDKIIAEKKDGVDPGIEYPENPVKYKMTSDDFFNSLDNNNLDLPSNYKWDVIFIDGLHISTQVLKDINNSLNHIEPNGFILLHDCNPPNYFMQREDYVDANGIVHPWNGTVWKVIYHLRSHREDLNICVVDSDWGVGIIKRGRSIKIPFDNHFYEYNQMVKNRERDLGIIPPQFFESWI